MIGPGCPRDRRGAVMAEFAFVLPVFLLLVLGMIELSRGLMAQQIIVNGAREGARRAILPGATDDRTLSAVETYLTGTSVMGATTTISPSLEIAKPGEPITVSVAVPYEEIAWGPLGWLDGATLRAEVVMRKE